MNPSTPRKVKTPTALQRCRGRTMRESLSRLGDRNLKKGGR